MIKLIINEVPLPWAAPRLGRNCTFSPRAGYKKFIQRIVKSMYTGPLLTGAVICDLTFFMPIPKTTSKINRLKMISGMIRPKKKPDRINLGKLFEDCLEGIILKNDSQIVGGRVDKFYGENPRVEIEIREL